MEVKWIKKKLRDSIPKRGDDILRRMPLNLHIALGAQMKELPLSVLFYNPFRNTSFTIIRIAIVAKPLCRFVGMIITKSLHSLYPWHLFPDFKNREGLLR